MFVLKRVEHGAILFYFIPFYSISIFYEGSLFNFRSGQFQYLKPCNPYEKNNFPIWRVQSVAGARIHDSLSMTGYSGFQVSDLDLLTT